MFVPLYLSKEVQAFYNLDRFKSRHMHCVFVCFFFYLRGSLICSDHVKQHKNMTKGRRKQGNIVAQKMFLENFKSIFCFQDAGFVSLTYVAWGHKRGITWETLKKH